MKRLVTLVLSMALLLGCFQMNAFAEETTYPKVSHTYITTEDFASDEWQVDQRGAYLASGTSSIAKPDGSHANISGDTTATRTIDTVRLTLYLERSKSYATGYGTYKTYSYSANNVYQLAKGISNIPVDGGYYYRVRGVHSVTHNGTTECTDSVTNPIYFPQGLKVTKTIHLMF